MERRVLPGSLGWDGASAVSGPLPRGISSSSAGTVPVLAASLLPSGRRGWEDRPSLGTRVRACAHTGTHMATHRVTWAHTPHTKLPTYLQSTFTVTHTVLHVQSPTHPGVDPLLLSPARLGPRNPLTSLPSVSFSPQTH